MITRKCNQCESLYINGIFCHERGCPNTWQDRKIRCCECGFDFQPEERYQKICNACIESAEEYQEEG